MGDIESGVGFACGSRGIWELSVLSAGVCFEPKTSLKESLLIKLTKAKQKWGRKYGEGCDFKWGR